MDDPSRRAVCFARLRRWSRCELSEGPTIDAEVRVLRHVSVVSASDIYALGHLPIADRGMQQIALGQPVTRIVEAEHG